MFLFDGTRDNTIDFRYRVNVKPPAIATRYNIYFLTPNDTEILNSGVSQTLFKSDDLYSD